MRRQSDEDGTPSRTVGNFVEKEGDKLQKQQEKKTDNILQEHSFDLEWKPQNENENYGLSENEASVDNKEIENAIENYNKNIENDDLKIESSAADNFYEDTAKTVNITPDDVVVKKQKEQRSTNKKKDKKFVNNTIFHVENQKDSYTLNGYNTDQVLRRIIAFLLYNNIFEDYFLHFFIDGEKSLYDSIESMFDWASDKKEVLCDLKQQ